MFINRIITSYELYTYYYYYYYYYYYFLGSTAQLRPWPPPQNPAEFLGGFSTIFFLHGRVVSPTPNPHPGGTGLCIYIPQRQVGYPF
jgi:hypothetical protein